MKFCMNTNFKYAYQPVIYETVSECVHSNETLGAINGRYGVLHHVTAIFSLVSYKYGISHH